MISTTRQRWRITFRRLAAGTEQPHQAISAAWTEALAASDLPFPDGRPRLAFAMPLPSGAGVERDVVDVELAERLPVAAVRAVLGRTIPTGLELVDLHDVWPGEAAPAAQARRAEYAVTIGDAQPTALRAAVTRLLAADRLPRRRARGGRSTDYDLRPLLVELSVEEDGPPARLRIVVALDPERGAGRPEEVVAALQEAMTEGTAAAAPEEHPALVIVATVRRRIVLDADQPG